MKTNKSHYSLHVVLSAVLAIFSGASCSASKSQSELAAEDFAKNNDQASKEFPDELPSIARQKLSQKNVSDQFSMEADPDKRAKKAANIFIGFYFMGSRAFSDYCLEQNIDIKPFSDAFIASHANEHKKAVSILKYTPEREDGQYNLIRVQLRVAAEQHITDIATVNKTTTSRACSLIASNATYLSSEMHISKMQPLVYKELTNAK